ncbi:GNAT family N-acetyltransferase [Roseateles oligotrophus]|uniref:GNAT family N-acetyltransferase n=1 Tax=Roseateles oligotrophus TaxID=1769250 RepID=A0ABT2YLY8_9BURK|nr:GNAT family N-acetyltransferase [Roseateles oligotrophus]MCV2371068.1 GNAT family N-acetyltransferase [Roseateles oligotrophus]
MKKIGIVGGIAWASTVEYYRLINQWAQARHLAQGLSGTPQFPEFAIESVNMAESHARRGVAGDEASWARFDAYFHAALLRLQASGADFAIIASNTPHNRLAAITCGLRMPVLSIFEVVAKVAADLGVSDFLILGTEPTMQGSALPTVLQNHGIRAHVPMQAADRLQLATVIAELQAGPTEHAAEQIDALVRRSCSDLAQATRLAVGLACTELPLAFSGQLGQASFERDGRLHINTSLIHARAAFELAVRADETLTRRPASPDDVPFLLQLRRQTLHAYLTEAGLPIDAESDLARVMFKFDVAEVLLHQGAAAGLLKMTRSGKDWLIHQLQIAPLLQGRGLGAALLRQLQGEASAAGAGLSLGVLKRNPAQALYRRLGFVDDGENELEYLLRWPPN